MRHTMVAEKPFTLSTGFKTALTAILGFRVGEVGERAGIWREDWRGNGCYKKLACGIQKSLAWLSLLWFYALGFGFSLARLEIERRAESTDRERRETLRPNARERHMLSPRATAIALAMDHPVPIRRAKCEKFANMQCSGNWEPLARISVQTDGHNRPERLGKGKRF